MANIIRAPSLIGVRRGKPYRPILNPNDPINNGLFGCWWFGGNNPNGPVRDLIGRRPATVTGSSILGPSHHGGLCQTFNGSGQYAQTAALTNIGNAAAQTYSIWFRVNGQNSGFSRVWNQPVDDTATDTPAFSVGIYPSGTLTLFSGFGSGGAGLSSALTIGAWYHLLVSLVGLTGSFYLNGVLQVTNTGTSAPTNVLNYFARYNGHFTSDDAPCSIDHARMWLGRALTAKDAARLYAGPYAGILETIPRRRVGGSAGTQYAQSLLASAAASSIITRQTGKPLKASASATALLTRQTGKPLAASASANASLSRQAGKSLLALAGASAAITRQTSKILSATGNASAQIARQTAKLLTGIASAAALLTRQTGKTLPASAAAAAALLRGSVFTLTLLANAAASAALSRQTGKTLSASAGVAAGLSRGIGKLVAAIARAIASLTGPAQPPVAPDPLFTVRGTMMDYSVRGIYQAYRVSE